MYSTRPFGAIPEKLRACAKRVELQHERISLQLDSKHRGQIR
jgi:hypothetical protein